MHIRLMKTTDLPEALISLRPKILKRQKFLPDTIPLKRSLPFNLNVHQVFGLATEFGLNSFGVENNRVKLSVLKEQSDKIKLPEVVLKQTGFEGLANWEIVLELVAEENYIYQPVNVFKLVLQKENQEKLELADNGFNLIWSYLTNCVGIINWASRRPFLAGQLLSEWGGVLNSSEEEQDKRFYFLDAVLSKMDLIKLVVGGAGVIPGIEVKRRQIASVLLGAVNKISENFEEQIEFIKQFAIFKQSKHPLIVLALIKPYLEKDISEIIGLRAEQQKSLELSGRFVRDFFKPDGEFWADPQNKDLAQWFIKDEAERFKIGPGNKDYRSGSFMSATAQSYSMPLDFICEGFDIFSIMVAMEAFPKNPGLQVDFLNLLAHFIETR